MKILKPFVIYVAIAFMGLPLNAQVETQGWIPKRDKEIVITNFDLAGSLLPGSTGTLTVEYTPNTSGPGEICLDFPKHLAPVDQLPGETYRVSPVDLVDGQPGQLTIPVKVFKAGGSHFSVTTRVNNAVPENHPHFQRYVNVISSSSGSVRTYDLEPRTSVFQDEYGSQGFPASPILYHIIVDGRVAFRDAHQKDAIRGIPNARVQLRFLSGPGSLWHPMQPEEGATFSTTDAEGYFHFDFEFAAEDMTGREIILLVEKSNDAVQLNSDGGDYVLSSTLGDIITFSLSEGVKLPPIPSATNMIVHNDIDIRVNGNDGAILRHCYHAYEFVRERYDNNLPFELPIIEVIRMEVPDGKAGLFKTSRGTFPTFNDRYWIEIDLLSTDATTLMHEYGHFVNLAMWDLRVSEMRDATSQVKEGWAIFFSFAARNYGTNMYGDDLREKDDNTELAPFRTPRFSGIRYTRTEPSYSQFACYLWNIYDSYNDGNFLAPIFAGADNDDVGDQMLRVFETLRGETGLQSVGTYRSRFNAGLDTELRASANDIYVNMLTDPNEPMRSAQVHDGSYSVNTDGMTLYWQPRSYLTQGADREYGNYEAGYNIYRLDNGDWQLLTTVARGTNSVLLEPPVVYGLYKVSSVNPSGESYAPLYISQVDKRGADFEGERPGFGFIKAYPNPLQHRGALEYYLPEEALVTIEVFDISGAKIATLKQEVQSAGAHHEVFSMPPHASGTVIATLTAVDSSGTELRSSIALTLER